MTERTKVETETPDSWMFDYFLLCLKASRVYFPSEMRRGNCNTAAPQLEIRMERSGAPHRLMRIIPSLNGVIAVRDVGTFRAERRPMS